MGKSNLLGAWGEVLAAEYLRKKRYEIVAMGFRCRFGEIDIFFNNNIHIDISLCNVGIEIDDRLVAKFGNEFRNSCFVVFLFC